MGESDDASTGRHDQSAGRSARSSRIASTLATVVDRYGVAALFKPDRIALLLRQESPDATTEIRLVLTALAENVPQRLLAAQDDAALQVLLPQVVQSLGRHPDFGQDAAIWAVRTWATALALPVVGLPAHSLAPSPAISPAVVAASPATTAATAAATAAGFMSIVSPLKDAQRPMPAAPHAPTVAPADVAKPVPAPAVQAARPRPEERPRPAASPIVVPAARIQAPARASPDTMQRVEAGSAGPSTVSRVAQAPAAGEATDGPFIPIEIGSRHAARPANSPTSYAIPLVAIGALVAAVAAVAYGWHETRAAADQRGGAAATPSAAVPRSAMPEPIVIAAPEIPANPMSVAADSAPPNTLPAVPPAPGKPAPPASLLAATRTASTAVTTPARSPVGPVEVPRQIKPKPSAPATASASVSAPSTPECTRSTCGSIVAVRSLESAGSVELIVRMDDREIQAVRQTARWGVGTRVRRIGERYVQLAP